MSPIFAFNLGPQEIIILLLIGVLLFGRRLPEVGRYLGKGLVEFKKGLQSLGDQRRGGHTPPHSSGRARGNVREGLKVSGGGVVGGPRGVACGASGPRAHGPPASPIRSSSRPLK